MLGPAWNSEGCSDFAKNVYLSAIRSHPSINVVIWYHSSSSSPDSTLIRPMAKLQVGRTGINVKLSCPKDGSPGWGVLTSFVPPPDWSPIWEGEGAGWNMLDSVLLANPPPLDHRPNEGGFLHQLLWNPTLGMKLWRRPAFFFKLYFDYTIAHQNQRLLLQFLKM